MNPCVPVAPGSAAVQFQEDENSRKQQKIVEKSRLTWRQMLFACSHSGVYVKGLLPWDF